MLQKVIPFSDISPILKWALEVFEKYMRRSMAIPIPPTFASIPNHEPNNWPANKPIRVQIPSKAIPYMTKLFEVTSVN